MYDMDEVKECLSCGTALQGLMERVRGYCGAGCEAHGHRRSIRRVYALIREYLQEDRTTQPFTRSDWS